MTFLPCNYPIRKLRLPQGVVAVGLYPFSLLGPKTVEDERENSPSVEKIQGHVTR